MSNVYDGGPAFPEPGLSGLPNGEFIHGQPGMSLRAYFMAHAPAEPQSWFRPVMAETRPTPPVIPAGMTEEEADDMEGWREGVYTVDILSPRVADYAVVYEKYRKAADAHGHEAEKQRYLQWPAAWADEQLAILRGQP